MVRSGDWLHSKSHFKAQEVQSDDFAQIGEVRVKWMVVPCKPITVLAQQITDEGQATFRAYNPKAIADVDNSSSTEASCPIHCLCCFLVEKLFKGVFQETVNYCRFGMSDAD